MAPPVLARMTQITGDRKYIKYMDHEWDLTTKELYDPQERLYFRDATLPQEDREERPEALLVARQRLGHWPASPRC